MNNPGHTNPIRAWNQAQCSRYAHAHLEAGWANGRPEMWLQPIEAPVDAKKQMGALDADSQQAIASLIMGRMSLL